MPRFPSIDSERRLESFNLAQDLHAVRALLDSGVALVYLPGWLTTHLVPTPALGDDLRWEHPEGRPLMREAIDADRDAMFGDLYRVVVEAGSALSSVAQVIQVSDRDDPRLVEVSGLNDAQARAVTEAEFGCFVVEGLLVLEAVVLQSPYRLRSVLVSESKLPRVLEVLGDTEVDVYVGTPALLESVTGFPIHRGIIASAARIALPTVEDLVADSRRVVVVEGLNDHENMGAIFRNAAAFGVDAVLLDPTAADPLYRRSVRVSMGHLLRVPWTRTGALPGGLAPLRDAGFTTAALTPGGETSLHELDRSQRLAWVVGAEGPGLGESTMAAADIRVRIPIASAVDSLNVATAAAIAFSHDPGV